MATGIGGGISAGDAVWTITGDSTPLQQSLAQAEGAVSASTANIGATMQKIGVGMTVVGGAITGAMGLAAKSAVDFRGGLAEVATLGVQDMGMIEESVRALSKSYGLDLVEATGAAYQAISAGVSEMDAPRVLEQAAIAATAGVSNLTAAVELGTSVTNAFGYEMANVSGIYDQAFTAVKLGVTTFDELAGSVGKVSPMFAAAGLSSTEMFASITALTKGGLATTEAVTGIKAALTGIIKPTSEATELAAALGISFDATTLKSMGLAGFLDMLAKATGGNVETMAQLFGSVEGLNAVLALTGTQAESFDAAMAAMEGGAGAANAAFQKIQEQDPGFAFRQMRSEIEDLKVTIGDALLPALKSILEAVAPVVQSIGNFAAANPALFNTLVLVAGGLGAVMLALGPLFIAIPGIIALFGAIGPALAAVGTAVAAAAAALAAPITLAAIAVGIAVSAVIANWEGIKDGLDVIWDAIKWAASGVVDFLGGVWDGIVGVFTAGWDWISGILTQIADAVGGLFGGIGDMLGLTGGTIEARAGGGPVNSGQPYLVGENGPELFVPNGSGTIVPNGAGGGTSVTINLGGVSVRSDADIRNLSERLAEVTARELRAAGAYA